MTIGTAIGHAIEAGIRAWVRAFGRRVARADASWLDGPAGAPGPDPEAFYRAAAAEAGLEVEPPVPDAGLVADFGGLRGPAFDPDGLHPRVRAFYERTAGYRLEVWSAWHGPFGPLARVLVGTVSRRIGQINLPIDPLETAAGMTSAVLGLRDPASGARPWAGWLRRLGGSGATVYAGFYTTTTPPLAAGPCVKVVFPVTRGSATVILRPEHGPDGSLVLVSSGDGFGGPGFYRVHRADDATLRARYVPAMKERIHVYVDAKGDLRTDHHFRFFRWRMLTLHYLIVEKAAVAA